MFTYEFTLVYLCLPLFSRVYLCFQVIYFFTPFYSYLPKFTPADLCLPLFTRVYICLLVFTYV